MLVFGNYVYKPSALGKSEKVLTLLIPNKAFHAYLEDVVPTGHIKAGIRNNSFESLLKPVVPPV